MGSPVGPFGIFGIFVEWRRRPLSGSHLTGPISSNRQSGSGSYKKLRIAVALGGLLRWRAGYIRSRAPILLYVGSNQRAPVGFDACRGTSGYGFGY
jgi:hypothetical protein